MATFCPLLFSKVARLKPLRPKGLRVFWPLSHFFSSLKCEKKILKFIYKWRKKVANWPAREFWRVSGGYLRFWSRSLVEPSKFLFQNGWRCAILILPHILIAHLITLREDTWQQVFSLLLVIPLVGGWDCVATMEGFTFCRVRLFMGRTLLFCP